MKVLIVREYNQNETKGNLFVFDELKILFRCVTLELPELNNQKNYSCIPEGRYFMVKYWTPTKWNCFYIQEVPGRENILIHAGNYVNGKKIDSKGCILPGKSFLDLNSDGFIDVDDSRVTLDALYKVLPDRVEIHII